MLTRKNENHVDHTALTDGWFTNGTAAVKNALVSWNEQQLPLPFRVSLCLPLCDLEPNGTSSCCQAAADVGCGSRGLPSVGNLQKPNRTNPRWLPVPGFGFSWKFTGRRGGQILTCNPMLRGEATMICPFTTSYAYHCLFCSLL